MRRPLLTLAVAGLLGSLLLASDASACCHKRQVCVQQCQPCPPPPPCPEPAPCAPAKKCCLFGGGHFKLFGRCHRQPVCPQPVCYTAPAPCAPCEGAVYATGQVPSGQN